MKYSTLRPAMIFLACFSVLAGCAVFPERFYIGGYTIKTQGPNVAITREEVKNVISEIADTLGYETYFVNDSRSLVQIGLSDRDKAGVGSPRVVVTWVRVRSDQFEIAVLKTGPEENEKIVQDRRSIEAILSKYKFLVEFELSHRTMAR